MAAERPNRRELMDRFLTALTPALRHSTRQSEELLLSI
jgi:hypothetical protein